MKKMISNSIMYSSMLLALLLFYFRPVYCLGRTFSSQKLCQSNGDCSYQIGYASDMCHVRNTSCEVDTELGFEQLTTSSTKYPSSEGEANFQISILPYVGQNKVHQKHNVDAINITLRSFTQEITGYYIEISEVPFVKEKICKLFDFRQAAKVKPGNFSLYYDCLHSLDMDGIYTLKVIARALPINEELQYMMYLPDVSSIEPSEECHWKPLILVLLGSLKANKVSVQFSKAPSFYDLRQYKISLIYEPEGENDVIVETKLLEPKSERDMMHVEFENVDIGCYHVHIELVTWKNDCNHVRSNAFCVPPPEQQGQSSSITIGLSVLSIIVVVMVASIIMFRGISALRSGSFSRFW